jgi:hypothetical protein
VELRTRFAQERDSHLGTAGSDEALVADLRGRLTPAQVVEQKLHSLLPQTKTPGPRSLSPTSHSIRVS